MYQLINFLRVRKFFLFFLLVAIVSQGISQILNSPESIVYDTKTGMYIISNSGNGKTGGSIVSMDPVSHDIFYFVTSGVNSPKGLCIVNDVLYCTDVTSVIGFNINDGAELFRVEVQGSGFLNDITSDNAHLFVSDNSTNTIYKVDIISKAVEVLVSGGSLIKPNGLYFDDKLNRILICSYRAGSTIQAYDLKLDRLFGLTSITLDYLDGITLDTEGNCYVSSWADEAVYMFKPDFTGDPEVVSNGHFGPADIYFSSEKDMLAIPNFNSDAIDFIEIGEQSIEEEMNPYIIKIFPNPASGEFVISYYLNMPERVEVYFINKSGRMLFEKKIPEDKTGPQHLSFETKSLGLRKGVFFIKMIIGDNIYMKRIAILE